MEPFVDHIRQPRHVAIVSFSSEPLTDLFWIPTYPPVSHCELDRAARETRDSDDGMRWSRSIPDESHEGTTRDTLVGVGPSVSEVPPDSHKFEPGDFTTRTRFHDLEVWVHNLAKRDGS